MGLELMNGSAAEPDALARSRAEILRNMAELDQLIDEILLASRLDAKEADIGTVEAVDLVGLCAEECARVGAVLDVPPGLSLLEVPGVAKLLRRMVRNLLENAVRYGAHLPVESVVLRLQPVTEQVLLSVRDRGPGVPEPWRQRIFEPFFRLPGSSESSGSVGLGLALVKSIANRHGGQVQCLDHPGGGALFVVTLPAHMV
jgi:signal transduction histidine kinase